MIKDLIYSVSNNRSGILTDQFYYVPMESVKGEDLLGLVVLKSDTKFYKGQCTRYSSSFARNSVTDPNGPLINPEFVGVIPKINAEKEATLKEMDGKRFVLLYKDRNGGFFQVGGFKQGLRFTYKYDTGEGAEGRNQASIRFSAERMRKQILPYNKELILSTTAPGSDTGGDTGSETPVNSIASVTINGFTIAPTSPNQVLAITSPYTLNYQLQ